MLNTIKWVIIGPVFLILIYVLATFSPLFRGAVLFSIKENTELLSLDVLRKKIEADK